MTTLRTVVPPDAECATRAQLEAHQLGRLRALLDAVYGANPFYTRKLDEAGVSARAVSTAEDLRRLPFTSREELASDQDTHPPWGTALTDPLDRYTRYHQTTSTTGRPLRWPDTNDSWAWVKRCWAAVYRAAHVTAEDRIFFPFGFGPFLGFWSAFDAGSHLGAMVIPGGGMSSESRLRLLAATRPTVVCCTPTYALRLAQIAGATGLNAGDANGRVRALIVAGEPGGSIPATRAQLETAWGARVIDHHGLTEVGPISFECWESPGALHLNECEFICEVVDPATGDAVADGDPGELVVTNLGRTASPVIRYRTRDIVRLDRTPCPCGRTLVRAVGGILSRADDMVCVRGVNVYPTAIEAVVRQFTEVVEYRSTISTTDALSNMVLDIELDSAAGSDHIADRVAEALRESMGLTIPVRVVAVNTLPRFEMKARRFVVEPSCKTSN
ncbi:MAG: AMP-binding protein [Acidobacteria bacterium]|nr:AMP-binding protein [Acidobacteriota bacterium]